MSLRRTIFSKNTVGLDLSDHSLEIVERSPSGDIEQRARLELPPGLVEKGRIRDGDALGETVGLLLEQSRIADIGKKTLCFALPEKQTFIHIFEAGKEEKDIGAVVQEELEAVLPLEASLIAYGYAACEQKAHENLRLTAIAADRKVVGEWKDFLEKLGFGQVSIGAETFASYVGLGIDKDLLPVCVVDIGADMTLVSFYDTYGACFSDSFDKAGSLLTEEAAAASGKTPEEVEMWKRRYGLRGSGRKKRIPAGAESACLPEAGSEPAACEAFDQASREIAEGIRDRLDYCREKRGISVANVVLIGGTSQVPGVLESFRQQLGAKVMLGNHLAAPSDPNSVFFWEAAGLAAYGHPFPVFDLRPLGGEKEASAAILEKAGIAEPSSGPGRRSRRKGAILLVLLVTIFLVSALVRRYPPAEERGAGTAAAHTPPGGIAQTLFLAVPVVTEAQAGQEGAQGRTILDRTEIVGGEAEAIQVSRLAVGKQLGKGESLWAEPLAVASSRADTEGGNKTITAYEIRWLAYDEKETNRLFREKAVSSLEGSGAAYSLGGIEKQTVAETALRNVYMVGGSVTVFADREIQGLAGKPAAEAEGKTESSAGKSKATVEDTGIGWLNVRREPDAQATIITRIYPGESYAVLAEEGDWVRLALDNKNSGWAVTRYLDINH
jgi:Tfp pilus assembly PilM family ATPase